MPGPSASDSDLDRLAETYVERLRRGEDAQVEDYARENPELADDIRELFPVLAAMEGLKPPPPARQGPREGGASPTPGAIGPYEIVRELGRGGMGTVYEAHTRQGVRVAVKVIHAHLVDKPGYVQRFLREIEAGRRLDHPGVVRTLGSGVATQSGVETPYLVLEFVDGQNLRQLLDEVTQLSERLCRLIGAQVASALAALHAAGMVHRDIKPENVVITASETVKLMDLGVALLQEESLRLSQTGEFVGSLLYAAPEQLAGEAITPAVDLYAVGLLLHELSAGAHPHARGGVPVLSDVISSRACPSLRSTHPEASELLDAVVASLLSVDPAGRIASAEELSRILEEGEESAWWKARAGAHPPAPTVPARRHAGRLFGRAGELHLLDRMLAATRRGKGRALLIEGEAGSGKTHLIEAWLARVAGEGAAPRVLVVEHTDAASTSPASPLARALLEQFGEAELETRLASALGGDAGFVAEVVRHLHGRDVLGRGISASAWESVVLRLMIELAEERGLVVVVEDLHRASEDWAQALLRLIRGVEGAPVLVVATARSPVESALKAALAELEHASSVELGALDREASFSIVRSHVGGVITSASGVRDLVDRAGGNPYFLIELTRELERVTRQGRDPNSGVTARPAIPRTLGALLEARLASLDTGARDLLAAAACAAEPLDPDVVVAAAELPRLAGLRMLHALDRQHGLLVPVGQQYRFRQQLVKEKLHEGLSPGLRAAYHGAIGRVLESRLEPGVPCPAHLAYSITYQFLSGDEPERAVPFANDALQFIVGQYEARRAAKLAADLLALGDRLPAEVRVNALFAQGTALVMHGSTREALVHFESAWSTAQALGNDELAMRILVQLVDCERESGELESALRRVEETLACIEDLARVQGVTELLGQHARLLRDMGRLEEAREAARLGLEHAVAVGDAGPIGILSFFLGSFLLESGDLAGGRVLLDQSVSIAHVHGERSLEAAALSSLAQVAYLEGRLDDAVDVYSSVLSLARELGQTRTETIAAINLAQALPFTGDLEGAQSNAERARAVSASLGYAEIHARAVLALADVQYRRGRLGEALSLVEEASSLFADIPTPVVKSRMHMLRGRVLRALARPADAEAALAEAMSVAAGADATRELLAVRWERGLPADVTAVEPERLARLEALVAEVRERAARHVGAELDLRLGELHAAAGDEQRARTALEAARSTAERGGLRGTAALSRIWLDLLPGARPLRARLELDKHAEAMPVFPRLRAMKALVDRSGDGPLAETARAAVQALLDSAPEEDRARMRVDVPLYRHLLDG